MKEVTPENLKKHTRQFLLLVFCIIMILVCFSSCGIVSKSLDKTKQQTTTTRDSQQTKTKTVSLFEQSDTNKEEYRIIYTPIDPTLDMIVSQQSGSTKTKNARQTTEKIRTKTGTTTKGNAKEVTALEIQEKLDQEIQETNRKKFSFNIPWYGYLIIVFGIIILIIVFYFMKKFSKALSFIPEILEGINHQKKT